MSSLVAKHNGTKKSISLVENMDYIHLSQSVGVNTLINKKLLAENLILAWVATEFCLRLFVAIINAKDPRPLRPGIVVRTTLGRFGQQLKVDETSAAMSDAGGNTIRPCIATPDHDHAPHR